VDFTIVIPTYNERDNVPILVERIHAALADSDTAYELFFVDDSQDDTPTVLAALAQVDPTVRFLHREANGGLGSAVVEGFRRGTGRYFVVMDADLQHPPELLSIVFSRLLRGIDIVIPSRFVQGGSDGGLGTFRKFVSWVARVIGQRTLRRLRDVSDCTGGFFGVRKDVIDDVELNPIGWKILIEVLVKGRYSTVHELPYAFQSRDAGESKMSLREQWNYLRHIWSLMWNSESDRRFYVFCIVGLSGVVVNLAFLYMLLYWFKMHEIPSSVLASIIAMISNFIWHNSITWRDVRQREVPVWHRRMRVLVFMGISSVGIGITTLVMQGLRHFGAGALLAQGLGIVLATIWNYMANKRFTWNAGTTVSENDSSRVLVTREAITES